MCCNIGKNDQLKAYDIECGIHYNQPSYEQVKNKISFTSQRKIL